MPDAITPPLCRHCLARKGNRARGLCWRCSLDASVRDLYPPSNSVFAKRQPPEPRMVDRLPGDAPWRCFWCCRWVCPHPLSLCGECQAWYDAARADMPEDDEECNGRGTKISPEKRQEMEQARRQGANYKQIAARYGVSVGHAWTLCHGIAIGDE